jgi:hypothetical protein
VELILNLLWLAASVSLGVILFRSRSRRSLASKDCLHSHSAVWVSYLILIAMLLPVISMTDDLQAMVTPADSEQIARRFEAAATSHAPLHLPPTMFLPVASVWLAPVVETRAFDAVRDFNPSYIWHWQTIQGRAPPVAG